MNRSFAVAFGMVTGLLVALPAQAGGRVHWSVTVGSPGYVLPPPAVVVSPQPHYSYGPPPSAFAQPPTVVYVQPVYPVYPPPVLYVDPYGRAIEPRHSHRHDHRHGHRHSHRQGWNSWDDGHRGGRWDYRR